MPKDNADIAVLLPKEPSNHVKELMDLLDVKVLWYIGKQLTGTVHPLNLVEIRAVEADAGNNLGYVRAVTRRRQDAKLDDIVQSVTTKFSAQQLFRSAPKGT